jgi:REP element-mobilizing transposase RayT
MPPNALFESMAKTQLKEKPFRMNLDDRLVVENTIAKHCELRNWPLYVVNERSNHVHAVLSATTYSPETVRNQLKAWCTRRLKKSNPDRTRFWSEGASCRWINHDEDLDSAVLYASNEVQDNKR